MNSSYENTFATYQFIEGNLHLTYKRGVDIDLIAAKKIVYDRIKFQQDVEYPVVCDIRKINSVTKAARDYLTLEGLILISALAIYVKPGRTSLMVKLHFRANKPRIPIFTINYCSR